MEDSAGDAVVFKFDLEALFSSIGYFETSWVAEDIAEMP
jgi:hypothetical protein